MASNGQTVGAGVTYGQYVLERCGGWRRQAPNFKIKESMQANHDLINVFVADIEEWANSYNHEAKPIETSPLLSRAGILEKLNPIQEKYNKKFNEGLVARCRNLQNIHFAKVAKIFELPPEVVGVDPVILEMRSQEIRQYIRTLPLIERIQLALSNDDPALLYALDNAAPCLQLLPPELMVRSKEFRVRRRRGAELKAAEDERLALDQVTKMLKNVPNACPWVHISPLLPGLPDTVFPNGEDEYGSEAVGTEAIKALSAELAAAVISMTP